MRYLWDSEVEKWDISPKYCSKMVKK